MFPIAISAMSAEELREMVEFRWMVAGGKTLPFAEDGGDWYKTLYAYSKGLPRDAVKVCDEVLRDITLTSKKQATAANIGQIAKELNLTL